MRISVLRKVVDFQMTLKMPISQIQGHLDDLNNFTEVIFLISDYPDKLFRRIRIFATPGISRFQNLFLTLKIYFFRIK